MSVFKKDREIARFPAYFIVEREADSDGFVNLTAGEALGVDSKRGFYNQYSASSVVSYALQYNECPIAAVEQAKSRGHNLHWINASAVSITREHRPAYPLINIEIGMKVRFEGLLATIERAPNNNLKFVPV